MTARRTRIEGRPERLETPPDYVAWTADAKQRWLWDRIQDSAHRPETLPPLRLPFQADPWRELAVVTRRDQLATVLRRTDDLLEAGRPKVIHARGSVASVALRTAATSSCTGLLGPPPHGGADGLLRLSLVARVSPRAAYTPGMGLKLLVDGHPSADVLAMNHTVGQGRDYDVFTNTMTNDLSDEHDALRPPQRIMKVLFDRVSANPRRLSSRHLADRSRDGSTVAEPVVPHRLVLHPTDAARAAFVDQAGVDFRLVLATIPTGTTLYEIEAIGAVGDPMIGALTTTSPFVSSDAGDRLFFRHVQDPGDPRLRS